MRSEWLDTALLEEQIDVLHNATSNICNKVLMNKSQEFLNLFLEFIEFLLPLIKIFLGVKQYRFSVFGI